MLKYCFLNTFYQQMVLKISFSIYEFKHFTKLIYFFSLFFFFDTFRFSHSLSAVIFNLTTYTDLICEISSVGLCKILLLTQYHNFFFT